MNDQQKIKNHYNKKKNMSNNEREKTKNINIRNANNAIKYALIKAYVQKDDTVLDLGIGKGGDLRKYALMNIKELVGIDISNRSVLDAINRIRNEDKYHKYILRLKIKDAFGDHLDFKRKFDIVSSQLAFHYAFVCKNTFLNALRNINRNLKEGGYFIFTTISKTILMERKENNNLSNSYYKVVFKDPTKSNFIFGNSYYFTLVDSIDNCVEYLVDIDELILNLNSFNFKLVEIIPFDEVIDNEKYNKILGKKRELIEKLNNEEREVFKLHDLVVFQKLNNEESNDIIDIN